MGNNFSRVFARFCITFTILGFAVQPSFAVVFNVSNTNDTYSYTSLRGAVIAANFLGGRNTIILGRPAPPRPRGPQPAPVATTWIYHLTISGGGEDKAKTGDIDVTRGDLTIIGVATNVVIDANGLLDRVFHVMPNAKLTLINITITGGYSYTIGHKGGAIYNSGILLIQNCNIVGNSSGDTGNNITFEPSSDGGGIFNDGRLTIQNSFISENSPRSGGNGGGIFNEGFVQLENCIINDNSSGAGTYGNMFGFGMRGGNGGGIYNVGTATINGCHIFRNICGSASSPNQFSSGNGGSGGGIFNGGNLTCVQSTFDENHTGTGGDGGTYFNHGYQGGMTGGNGGSGAGIFNSGKLSLSLSTISGNGCGVGGNGGTGGLGGDGGSGGGIYNVGSVTVNSCTVAGNAGGDGGLGGAAGEFPAGSGGNGGSGGGLLNAGNSSSVQIKNSLIALNAAGLVGAGGTGPILTSDGQGPDLAGDFTSQGFNLISIGDGSMGFANSIHADQVGTAAAPINPKLGLLQMNGGSTPTHALLSGSPAVDQGNSFGLRTDQRGSLRPFNNKFVPNALGGDGSDIGAFELQP